MLRKQWISCKKGFTLMETLVSVGLLGFLSIGLLSIFLNNMHYGEQEKNRTASFYLMEDTIEKIYRVNINQIANYIDNGKFDWAYDTLPQFRDFSITVLPDYLTINEPNSNMPTYLITVQVKWRYKGTESDVLERIVTKTEIGGV